MSHGIFEPCTCKEGEPCTCNCHSMSVEEVLPKPVVEEPTQHAQALARIEEEVTRWRKDIELFSDLIPDSEADQLAKSQLSAWQTLKAVLELHQPGSVSGEPIYCGYCVSNENGAEYRAYAPCPTHDLIIKGVLGE